MGGRSFLKVLINEGEINNRRGGGSEIFQSLHTNEFTIRHC